MSDPLLWVYTEGVFDLFHAGHVEFLRQARQLGDRLVVGLVSDADTASYKPPPILTFAERQAVVRACRHVDRVLNEASPLITTCAFLDEIGAMFCCHGDDFNAANLAKFYGDLIPAGRLKTVKYSADISSRDIVRRIAARLKGDGVRVAQVR